MKDNKICFSKTFVTLILLIAVVVGGFWVMNYANKQKLALNSQAASLKSNVSVLNKSRQTAPPDFTLLDLKSRAKTALAVATVAKSRSATMDTDSIQSKIEGVNKKLEVAVTSFNDLKNDDTLLKNLRIKQSSVISSKNKLMVIYNTQYLLYMKTVTSYNEAVKYAGGRPENTQLTKVKNEMYVLKAVVDKIQVNIKSYEYLSKLINQQILNTSNVKANLSENKKLPDLLNTILSGSISGLNAAIVSPVISELVVNINTFNKALNSTYDAYINLDVAIKNIGESVIPTQVQAYRNYCSNVKPGTYYSIEGIDKLLLDKAQQYYDDYCGQNATGYGWNGIVGDYGKPGGAMCYTATGLCSPIPDCKKVDCISRIGKGVACLNKPVTDAAGKAACAAQYMTKLGVDILTRNECPQNNSNKISWYGGRNYKVSDTNGIKTTISGSDTCLRLNASNKKIACNTVISDNYCGCKDAEFTYVNVNGTYKNMVDELYGSTALYRPKKSTSKPENLTTDRRFEKCPFVIN